MFPTIDMNLFMELFSNVIGYLSTHGFTLHFLFQDFGFTYLSFAIGAIVVITGIRVIMIIFDW